MGFLGLPPWLIMPQCPVIKMRMDEGPHPSGSTKLQAPFLEEAVRWAARIQASTIPDEGAQLSGLLSIRWSIVFWGPPKCLGRFFSTTLCSTQGLSPQGSSWLQATAAAVLGAHFVVLESPKVPGSLAATGLHFHQQPLRAVFRACSPATQCQALAVLHDLPLHAFKSSSSTWVTLTLPSSSSATSMSYSLGLFWNTASAC